MADHSHDDDRDADEVRSLSEVRTALEAVERQQDDVRRQRRRLRARLDGLLAALREDAVVLSFDADGELVEAAGAIEEELGVSSAELVSGFEEIADEETIEALEEANRTVLAEGASGACVSDGFLRGADEELAVTFVHLRRDEGPDGEAGVEVIGLVAPTADGDQEGAHGADPFDDLLDHLGRRLLDDAGSRGVERAVQNFGDFLNADRVVVNRYDEEQRKFSVLASWLRGGTDPLDAETRGISISELPWAYSALGAGEAVVISESAELPADATSEKELYAGDGVKSSLLVPMVRRDGLSGFISVQAAHQERDWGAADIARARKFAVILSAALARVEAEAALAGAREEAEQASAGRAEAQSRAAELEEREAEARRSLDALTDEAEDLRSRVARLEGDAERVRKEEQEAREAAEQASRELDEARKDAEEARKDAEEARKDAEEAGAQLDGLTEQSEGARDELKGLREEAERAQRRAEDAAADALSVRRELEEVRRELDDARREAAELRALGRTAGPESPVVVEEPTLADDEGMERAADDEGMERAADDDAVERGGAWPEPVETYDPDATIEMNAVRTADEGFDPDGTLETEPSRLAALQGAADEAEETEEGDVFDRDDVEHEDEGARADEDGDDLARAVSLDEMLEPTQTLDEASEEPSRWKQDKASWEDSTDEVDLPEFLERGRHDDEEREEADAGGEDRSGEGELSDVEAARRLAREVAGKEAPDDDEDEHEGAGGWIEERDGREVAFEASWDRDERGSDDLDEPDESEDLDDLGAEPPASTLPQRVERTGEMYALDRSPADGDEDEEAAAAIPPLKGVDTELGLADVGGNVELYRNLLGKFRNDYIGAAKKIESAIEKGNIEVAHLLLHAVKGVAGVLGALRVRDAADELESRLLGRDPEATRAAVDEFREALQEALDAIAGLDGAGDGGPSAAAAARPLGAHVSDPMVLRSYLSGLRQHLVAEKPRQCMLVMREITARNWPGDYNARVAELAELVDSGDFEAAREAYDDLIHQFTDR